MDKILPHDIEAEQCIIGAILIDRDIIEEYFEHYSFEMFYIDKHITIMEAMFELYNEHKPIDIITVKEQLEKNLKLKEVGDIDYLIECTQIIPTTANWSAYAEIVNLYYKRREIIQVARKIERDVFNGDKVDNIIEKHFTEINKTLLQGKTNVTSMENDIEKLKKHINDNKGKALLGYSWGLPWLDDNTRGIRKGKTYRIGSPSGVGKSNLVYQIIPALLKQGAKVLFISLENSIETTYVKILSSVHKINSNSIESGNVEVDVNSFLKYKDKFFLTDQLFDINEIKREVLKVKPDVVILDYIGLVSIPGKDEKTKYDVYADEVKTFVQKNQYLSWIDLSNLNKDDDELKIRMHKGFNGSAKLRNNTDFAMHMFYYQPFYEAKTKILSMFTGDSGNDKEQKDKFRDRQAITFLISKNRMGRDGEEEAFIINYNEGYNYSVVSDELRTRWNIY